MSPEMFLSVEAFIFACGVSVCVFALNSLVAIPNSTVWFIFKVIS